MRKMPSKKSKSDGPLKVGATVHLKVLSGEIVECRVVHIWQDKSVQMVRLTSGPLVYNVPISMLVDGAETTETESDASK